MKIILLYGPGEVGKRNEGLKIRKSFLLENISHIDLKQAEIKDLDTLIISRSLLETGPRLIVVENIGDKVDLKDIKKDEDLTLVLLAGNLKAECLLLKSAKEMGVKITLFEGEKELLAFPYLDYLIEKKKQSFVELEKLLGQYGGIYILSMIYYLLRRNILPLPASIFMKQKIIQQKKMYKYEDWINFYRLILKTEYNIKSGRTSERLGLTRLTQKFLG